MNKSHSVWQVGPDLEIEGLIEQEKERQRMSLQLIASENFASPSVMRATGSIFTNKYSEGYPRLSLIHI